MWVKKKPQNASWNTAAKENDQSYSLAAIIQTFLIEECNDWLIIVYYFMNIMNFEWHKAGLFIFLYAILRNNDLTILYNLKVFHFLIILWEKGIRETVVTGQKWLIYKYWSKRRYLSLRRLQFVAYFGGVDQGGLIFRLRKWVQHKKRLLSVER